jgi:hypothetical protein
MAAVTVKTKIAKAGFTFCLECLVEGNQIAFKYPMCIMRCPKCGNEWRVLSSICEKCHIAAGVPYAVECKPCNSRLKAKQRGGNINCHVSTRITMQEKDISATL